MTDQPLIQRFSNNHIRAIYTGRRFGNLDVRFGSAKGTAERLNTLQSQIGAQHVAIISAEGGSEVLDLRGQKLNRLHQEFKGDGLITDSPDVALALFAADCIPLAIYSHAKPLLALVHAGRPNVQAGLIAKVIRHLKKASYRAEELGCFIGPSIRQNSYSYPEIDQMQSYDPDWQPFLKYDGNRYYIDLTGLTKKRLVEAGLNKSQITDCGLDTGASDDYFSHVRSKQFGVAEGRNGFIVELI